MNVNSFNAEFITCQEADGVVIVGFADDQFAPSKYVILQRTLVADEQDKNLGLDGVYLEVDSPDKSGYDGVDSIQLRRTDVQIVIGAKLLPVVGSRSVHVSFSADDATFKRLQEHLTKLVDRRVELIA